MALASNLPLTPTKSGKVLFIYKNKCYSIKKV